MVLKLKREGIMKLLMCLLVCVCFAVPCAGYDYENDEEQMKYNWSTNKYEYTTEDEVMKYNWSTNEYEYTEPESQMKYNWSTGKYEY